MKFFTTMFLALCLALTSGIAFADEMVSVKLGYQVMSPSGQFAGEVDGASALIDMEDDLDFGDSEDVTAEIALQLGNSRLSFNYLPLGFSGTGTGVFEFNGVPFTGAVKGEVSADIYDIGYTYYLLNFDDLPTRFQLGIEVAAKIVEGKASLEEVLTGQKEEISGTAPIPTIGLRTRVALADFLGLSGRVGYIEYDDNTFIDADVQLEFSPLPLAGIYGGYRILDLDVSESELLLDVDFSGPYIGAFVRF